MPNPPLRVDKKTNQHSAKTEKTLPMNVKVPNTTTVKAMQAADKGKGKRLASAEALFRDLGI